MATRIIFFCCTLSFVICTQAQIKPELVRNKETGDYRIFVKNDYPETRTVVLEFKSLLGYKASRSLPAVVTVRPGTRPALIKLTPITGASTYDMSYKVRDYRGCATLDIDTDVRYLFPVTQNKEVQVVKLKSLDEFVGMQEQATNFNGYAYKLDQHDTIYAMRRGRIISVKTEKHPVENGNAMGQVSYSSNRNSITVEHEDCSYGQYTVFLNESAMVAPGDEVVPGDPLALAGGEGYSLGYHVRFMAYTFDNEKVGKVIREKPSTVYTPIKMIGQNELLKDGQTYVNDFTIEHVLQEFSKREIKKWKKKHNID